MANIFKRIELPLPQEKITALIGKPFDKWPEEALRPWWWAGSTRSARIERGQWHRPRALIQFQGKIISPARVLYSMYTGYKFQPHERLQPNERGNRNQTRDDVNPAHYHVPDARPIPTRKYKQRLEPVADILGLMATVDFWPSTVDELLGRWPELSTYSREQLYVTINAT